MSICDVTYQSGDLVTHFLSKLHIFKTDWKLYITENTGKKIKQIMSVLFNKTFLKDRLLSKFFFLLNYVHAFTI